MKSFIALCILLFIVSNHASAASQSELHEVKKQQNELKNSQRKLNLQLKRIGQQVYKLDTTLVSLLKEQRHYRKEIQQLSQQIADIKTQSYQREQQLKQLQKLILREASGAYKHANMQTSWIRSPLHIVEIPHRKYMLQQLITKQQHDIAEHQQLIKELAKLRQQQQQKHLALHAIKAKKAKNISEIRAKRKNKKQLWAKVDHDKYLKKLKLATLKKHEKQLRQLLSRVQKKRPSRKIFKRVKRKGNLKWPLKGKIVVQFAAKAAAGQPKLSGVQIAPTSSDRNVHVIADGQISYAGFFTSYGLMMIVNHGHGLMSVYAHNQALHKKVGDSVKKGEVLAQAGSTGWVRNTRLYFEIRQKGKPSNPELWCR